ncbi:hypothetical protein DND132_1012 [Pseudodesulfovibrio mercurii]|uniref:STAS/SEC14 domain-containing protein n=1 Tax=Pseudodesulfovibrio mercurii TaxID=641491 RepID=F0JIH3_9BACT|nr:hypothetical protein [Pseudodesulfovibrio mercurii]EGB14225.1 hypothetical protein DND132_1012 [Pseudodesulfovibrio mercurii]
MPIRYHSEVEGDHLHVVIAGSLCSVEEMICYIDRIHDDLVLAGLCRVLADETNCHVHMNFDALKHALDQIHEPEELLVAGRKSAVVSSGINHVLSRHMLDPIGPIKVFTDEEAARRWLAEV